MSAIAHALDSRVPSALAAGVARLRAWCGLGATAAGEEPLLLTDRIPGEGEIAPLDRLTIAQWLWGAGFHLPGGTPLILELAKPFALTPAMSMLDVSAGLGGGARAIAEAFGTYVTGLERDPDLARRGMEMSVAQGMQKHAPVEAYDPETLELKAGAFDCIMGRLATHAVRDKERFLRVLSTSLKTRGQLLVTDFVLEPKAGKPAALAIWERAQARRPELWSFAQYLDCFRGLGLEIRINEETTERHRRLIVSGWSQLLQSVDLRAMPRKHLVAVLDEAEHWVQTLAAIDSGALRTYRFYVLGAKGGAAGKR
ncbi:MAG TPA: methyltransferase domain-containing protein [Stellaceae bacterium]|nr:methyltransferase domain-containing protein [Stellaceae bacterium]